MNEAETNSAIFPIRLIRKSRRARQPLENIEQVPPHHDSTGIRLMLDGQSVTVPAGSSLLDAARVAGVFIPALCAHPELPPACGGEGAAAWAGCGLCLVAIEGEADLQHACRQPATAGMVVSSQHPQIQPARQQALAQTLAHHPHVCLTCPQRDGCSRVTCSFGHPLAARCCDIFNHCELRQLADQVGIPGHTPDYRPQQYTQPLPVVKDEPFYDRDYNLCIDCRRCLVACNEVRGVGCLEIKTEADGRRWVGTIAATLVESGCMFCNACVEVCLTGALLDRTQPAQKAKKVTQQQVAAPCTNACPAGIDVPRYVQLAGLGQFAEANAVVREKLPFPGILGRACYAPCETDCRRGHLDDPLSIRSLKRIAHEHDDGRWRELQRRLPGTHKRVAVIGAGPAGLTAAFYLAKQGHAVTIFEAQAEAGGMARYGIPAYRLPRHIIADEVAEVAAVGVALRFNTRIDSLQAAELQQVDAVFIAIGAQAGKALATVDGVNDMDGMNGVDFLRDVASGQLSHVAAQVTVIGGGDVACDAARSALRLGARQVDMVYRQGRAQLKAHPSELADALAEGVHLHLHGRLQQMTPMSPRPLLDGDAARWQLHWQSTDDRESQPPLPATTGQLITAIGQQVVALEGLALSAAGVIAVDETGRLPGMNKIFAGGDAVTGPSSLIEAVAQGRQAASAIDRFLGGDGQIDEVLLDAPWRDWQTPDNIHQSATGNSRLADIPAFNQRKNIAAPKRKWPVGQHQGWQEIEQCYAVTDACGEALRCLKCNLMHEMVAAELPPDHRQPLTTEQVRQVPVAAGVYFIFAADQRLLVIKGVADLQQGLQEALDRLLASGEQGEQAKEAIEAGGANSHSFHFELAHFYSQRENELLQAYSEQHGRLPPGLGDDELEDLF
ncbi:MAG: FAD-dependent oxidoreductase [Sterolibacterium sp.]|nr:FAD-dependent oxidoreductase [Sterolibacterium sp.]